MSAEHSSWARWWENTNLEPEWQMETFNSNVCYIVTSLMDSGSDGDSDGDSDGYEFKFKS